MAIAGQRQRILATGKKLACDNLNLKFGLQGTGEVPMPSSLLSRSFSLVLLLGIFLAAPVAGAQAPVALTGVYNGKYTCGQGLTNLKLSVVVSPIGDVSALFTFYLPAAAPQLGYTYSLHGQLDPQTGKVSLTPVRWETEHPANLGMVGMEGALSGDRLSGRITGGRCTTFDLTRDKGETTNIAAVITAQKNGGKPITPATWTAQLAAAQRNAQPAPAPAPQAKPPAPTAPSTPAPGASAQQRPAPPAAAPVPTVAGAKVPSSAAPPAGTNPPATASDEDIMKSLEAVDNAYDKMTNPVLKWDMANLKDLNTGGSSPHPFAHTFLDAPFDTIDARVSCNENGMSVFFRIDTYDFSNLPPVFVWHANNYEEAVTDVQVAVDGGSHVATGFPNEEGGKKWIPNEMGIFFYKPDLAQQAAAAQRLQLRTGTGLDSLIGPLVQSAAEAEVSEAQASSGGPVTDLLNAKSIRLDLSIGDWDKSLPVQSPDEDLPIRSWDRKPYLDLNPQDPVLHKFVAECATRWGIGASPAQAAPPASGATPPNQRMSR
jgi:hypothetical protein